MPVLYTLVNHRGEHRIQVSFAQSELLLNHNIKTVAGARWSRSMRSWHIPDTPQNRILCGLPQASDEGFAPLKITTQQQQVHFHTNNHLCAANRDAMKAYEQQMILQGYSENTRRTYRNEFTALLQVLKNKPASKLPVQRVKDYLQYCHEKLKLSESTIHSRMNALKFYYEKVPGKERFFREIPRPKKGVILPKVLSKEQVAAVLNAIENQKHRTMVMLVYACGLRISEVTALEVPDIDGKRRLLLVRQGKGKKDRVVSLSPGTLILLREYYRAYRPKRYLFEGQSDGEHLSARSLQHVMQKAKHKAGIRIPGSLHLLRHSFATHLLDKGIDVVFIQKLLGHSDIRTTLRYLHVTNKDLINIISPLADIEHLLNK